MSYNNIGLQTPRGSGTNGFVQRNLSAVFSRPFKKGDDTKMQLEIYRRPKVQSSFNEDIVEHQRRRKIEIKVLELRERLEDEGVADDVIEKAVMDLRTRLSSKEQVEVKDHNRHVLAKAKNEKIKKMKDALRIDKDYVHGEAFDQDLQEQKRQEKASKRESEDDSKLPKYSSSWLNRISSSDEPKIDKKNASHKIILEQKEEEKLERFTDTKSSLRSNHFEVRDYSPEHEERRYHHERLSGSSDDESSSSQSPPRKRHKNISRNREIHRSRSRKYSRDRRSRRESSSDSSSSSNSSRYSSDSSSSESSHVRRRRTRPSRR